MNRILMSLAISVGLTAAGVGSAAANTMGEYTITPPFVNEVVTPNILILMDNSLSMQWRACQDGACGTRPNGNTAVSSVFVESTTYSGFMDSMACYRYNGTDSRFEKSSTRAHIDDQCANTEWDGNLLNWMAFKRFDAVKKAMTGGDCAPDYNSGAVATRQADGTCLPFGTPAKATIQGQRNAFGDWYIITMYKNGQNPGLYYEELQAPGPKTRYNKYRGRIPDSVSQNADPLYFYWRNDRPGKVCVNDNWVWPSGNLDCVYYWTATSVTTGGPGTYQDTTYDETHPGYWYSVCDQVYEGTCVASHLVWQPSVYHCCHVLHTCIANCPVTTTTWTQTQDGDAFNEQEFDWRIAMDTEPTGVIQSIGNRARFGLMVFKDNSVAVDGARVLVGVGARQSIGFLTNTVQTFNTNNAAMLDAITNAYPRTQTPLAEEYYEAANYFMQLTSPYTPALYTYPIAFAPGKAFQATNGTGAVGPAEISALTGTETCPAGYGYITKACGRDPYFYGSNHTPAWATSSTVVSCCQTYVIIFTDGSPAWDQNIPATLQDYAHGTPPDPAAGNIHGLHCTGGNNVIHAANGTCNSNSATTAATLLQEHKTDYPQAGHYLDDVALWAHTTDLRQASIPIGGGATLTGHDLPSPQTLTLYTFFAFGTIDGREYLMNAAKQGAFIDSNGNNIPDLQSEWDVMVNSNGTQGTDGIPDAYFESSNVDDLQAKFLATIESILHRAAAGTAVSVLATSGSGEGSLYQAYFFPKTSDGDNEIVWTGYTQGIFVDGFGNMREDTNQDGRLVYSDDNIIRTVYDNTSGSVLIERYRDADGDGKADTPNPFEKKDLKYTQSIWEAGKLLAARDPDQRTIKTWIVPYSGGVQSGGPQEMDFVAANAATLKPYLDPDSTNETDIIQFIRGQQPAGTRNRQMSTGVNGAAQVWKLGDPVNSTPTVVSSPHERYDVLYGDPSYSAFYDKYHDRRMMVYVGANDGMLHAFNAGFYHRGDDASTPNKVEHGWFTTNGTTGLSSPPLGQEMWGYVPYQLLPFLKWLTSPSYTHLYYVDLKPKVTDARIFTPDTDHPNGWGTILIGGFRLGGSCGNCVSGSGGVPRTVTIGGASVQFFSGYFVLDITNPEVAPKLLWSYTDSALGFSTSYPSVIRLKPSCVGCDRTDNTDARWMMIVGDGPTTYDGRSTQGSNQKDIFAVDLKTGALVGSFTTGDPQAFMGMPAGADTNLDYRVDVVYAGTVQCNQDPTNADGDNNLCSGNSSPPWKGKFYRLTMNCATAPCTTATWGWGGGGHGPTLVLGTFPTSGSANNNVPPVTAAPSLVMDDSGKLWVFFGSGRYYSIADKTDSQQQYFFGIKDKVISSECNETSATNCEMRDLIDTTKVSICLVCTNTNQVTDSDSSAVPSTVTTLEGTTSTTLQGLIQAHDGWVIALGVDPPPARPRERLISNPIVLGGIVFFPTFVPGNDICTAAGEGYLYGLFYKTGSASKDPILGTTSDVINKSQLLGDGVPSQMAIQIGSQGSDANGAGSGQGCKGQITLISQSSTGATNQVCSATRYAAWSRFLSWNSQRD